MLYRSTIWSNTSTQNINKLQSIQNFASKIVTNSRKFDHVTPLLHQLNWLPVKQLLYYRDAVLTCKCLNGLAPTYLVGKFTKPSSIHTCHTRKRDLLHIPLYRTATGQRTRKRNQYLRSFAPLCLLSSIWNNLDNDIKHSLQRRIVMKPGKHKRSKQRFQDLCWKVHDRAQSFVLLSYATHELRNQHFSVGQFHSTE